MNRPSAQEIIIAISSTPVVVNRGFRMFKSLPAMREALRKDVMLKWMRQAHDAELAEPGDPPTSGILGVPEW